MPDIRQASFEIVHRLRESRTTTAVYTELNRARGVFGYDVFLIGGLPDAPGQNLHDCWMLSGWPSEWAQRYAEQRYIDRDPVIHRIRGSVDPFSWSEAAETRRDEGSRRVMDEATEFGLCEGLCVPFHEFDGSEAGVSFGGRRVRLSDDERAGLHLVALYAMSAAKAATGSRKLPSAEPERALLTDRETECLRWAAAGKTAWEISSILSLSERTVAQHLASAGRRLNAVTRVQCVAEALRRGIID